MAQQETAPGIGPLQADRKQDQGRETSLGSIVHPFQHAQRQEKGIYTLFLEERVRQTVCREQTAVQVLRWVGGAQLKVAFAISTFSPSLRQQDGRHLIFFQRGDDVLRGVTLYTSAPRAERAGI